MSHENYSSPQVIDYGTVRDLTAALGANFVDTPAGTPAGDVTASSSPLGQ